MAEGFAMNLKEKLGETFARIEATVETPTITALQEVAVELESLVGAFYYTAGYMAAMKEVKHIIEEKEPADSAEEIA